MGNQVHRPYDKPKSVTCAGVFTIPLDGVPNLTAFDSLLYAYLFDQNASKAVTEKYQGFAWSLAPFYPDILQEIIRLMNKSFFR